MLYTPKVMQFSFVQFCVMKNLEMLRKSVEKSAFQKIALGLDFWWRHQKLTHLNETSSWKRQNFKWRQKLWTSHLILNFCQRLNDLPNRQHDKVKFSRNIVEMPLTKHISSSTRNSKGKTLPFKFKLEAQILCQSTCLHVLNAHWTLLLL